MLIIKNKDEVSMRCSKELAVNHTVPVYFFFFIPISTSLGHAPGTSHIGFSGNLSQSKIYVAAMRV